MRVKANTEDKNGHAPEQKPNVRSHHHVEQVLTRIVAGRATATTAITRWHPEQEAEEERDSRWH